MSAKKEDFEHAKIRTFWIYFENSVYHTFWISLEDA